MLDYPESRDDRVNPPSLLYRLEDWSMGRKRSFKSYMKVTARALPSSHELTTLFLTHLLTSSLTYSLTYLLIFLAGAYAPPMQMVGIDTLTKTITTNTWCHSGTTPPEGLPYVVDAKSKAKK